MSPTQAKVITCLCQLGKPLEHWKGGFWTYAGCHAGKRDGIPIPAWWVSTGTIRAMRKRGWLEPVPTPENLTAPAWAQKLQVTEEGVAEFNRGNKIGGEDDRPGTHPDRGAGTGHENR